MVRFNGSEIPELFDPRYYDLGLQAPTIQAEINKIGSLTFAIFRDNANYGQIGLMDEQIWALKDNVCFFAARPRQLTRTMDGGYKYRCEELTGLLNDVNWPPKTFTGTPTQLLQDILGTYNAGKADADKFNFVESLVSQDSITVQNNEYIGCYDAIQQFLVGTVGGIIIPDYSAVGVSGVGISHITDAGGAYNYSQDVSVGENVLSASHEFLSDDFFTAILPLGKNNITIASVNSGSVTLEDDDLVAAYGHIEKVVHFDSITTASALKTAAQTALDAQAGKLTHKVKAQIIDLSCVNNSLTPYYIGQRAITELNPIGASGEYVIGKLNIALAEPEKSHVELGTPNGTLTDRISGANSRTSQAISDINGRISQ